MTPIAIVAHYKREAWAYQLAEKVAADAVIWDVESQGCTVNHLSAWEYLAADLTDDNQFAVVLEDDAVACEGFRYQLSKILSAAPADVVSLYLGTGRPPQWQSILRTHVNPIGSDPHFLLAPDLLSCVGYAVRARHVEPMIALLSRTVRPVDEAISKYCMLKDVAVAYSRPSVINHRDGRPLIDERDDGQARSQPRRAWKFGTRSHWESSFEVLPEPILVKTDEDGKRWYQDLRRVYATDSC